MNRQILVALVGMALAGCAQTWPAMPVSRTGSRLPPVGLTPFPNIYEAINRENPRLDPASLHPANGPVLANLGASPGANPGGRPGGAGTGPRAAASPCPDPACQPVAGVPQPPANRAAYAAAPASIAPPGGTGVGMAMPPSAPAASSSGSSPMPSPAPGPIGMPDPSMASQPEALPAPGPAPAPDPVPLTPGVPESELRQTSGTPVGTDPASGPAPAAEPNPSPGGAPEAVPLPLPPPAAPETLPPPAEGVAAPQADATAAAAGLEALPELPPGFALPPGAPPSPGQDMAAPGSLPPANLTPVPPLDAKDPPAPLPLAPAPAPAALPPANGPDAPTPLPAPAQSPAAAPTPGASARSGPAPTVDPAVVTAAADPTAMHAEGSPVKLKEAGHVAARVGDEIITLNELTVAVKEKIGNLPNGYKPNHQEIKMVASQVLDMLIERSTIIQEAKRQLKKPEQMKMFMDVAEKVWREEELPPLLRKMSVENEYKLREKLAEQGKSLDAMRDSFKQDFLARGFLEQKLRPKIQVTYSEMRDYYNAHLATFNRPEQWTWREVLIEVGKHPSRAEARAKADAILARLRRGDDFAQVARAESEGPNRSAGGLWETAPDSYAIAAVNDALRSLPIGQVSTIIEGPSSYHLVRVEARRPEGPASFAEVQDRIRRIVHQKKAKTESDAFLDHLRKQTVVTTIFDKTDFAPSATRDFNDNSTAPSTPTP